MKEGQPIQVEQDNLPRRADGTVDMGPQGWSNKWNKPSGGGESDKNIMTPNTTPLTEGISVADSSISEQTSQPLDQKIAVVAEKIKSEAAEVVVYQAPNRLPGSDRRVQPW